MLKSIYHASHILRKRIVLWQALLPRKLGNLGNL